MKLTAKVAFSDSGDLVVVARAPQELGRLSLQECMQYLHKVCRTNDDMGVRDLYALLSRWNLWWGCKVDPACERDYRRLFHIVQIVESKRRLEEFCNDTEQATQDTYGAMVEDHRGDLVIPYRGFTIKYMIARDGVLTVPPYWQPGGKYYLCWENNRSIMGHETIGSVMRAIDQRLGVRKHIQEDTRIAAEIAVHESWTKRDANGRPGKVGHVPYFRKALQEICRACNSATTQLLRKYEIVAPHELRRRLYRRCEEGALRGFHFNKNRGVLLCYAVLLNQPTTLDRCLFDNPDKE